MSSISILSKESVKLNLKYKNYSTHTWHDPKQINSAFGNFVRENPTVFFINTCIKTWNSLILVKNIFHNKTREIQCLWLNQVTRDFCKRSLVSLQILRKTVSLTFQHQFFNNQTSLLISKIRHVHSLTIVESREVPRSFCCKNVVTIYSYLNQYLPVRIFSHPCIETKTLKSVINLIEKRNDEEFLLNRKNTIHLLFLCIMYNQCDTNSHINKTQHSHKSCLFDFPNIRLKRSLPQ